MLEKQPADAIARIGKTPLRVSCKINNKLYDGNNDATFAENPFLTDLDNNPVSLKRVSLVPGIPYFESAEPGRRHIQFRSDFKLKGKDKKNYILDKSTLQNIFANIYKLPTIKIKSLTKEDGKKYEDGKISN